MSIRSTERSLVFLHPFALSGADGPLPSGRYWTITEEEPVEGLSFAAWRRGAPGAGTAIPLPTAE